MKRPDLKKAKAQAIALMAVLHVEPAQKGGDAAAQK